MATTEEDLENAYEKGFKDGRLEGIDEGYADGVASVDEGVDIEVLEELAELHNKGDMEHFRVVFNRYLKEFGSNVLLWVEK